MSTSDINKAYWINLVKEHGAEGGTSHLQVISRRQYPEVKEALDYLTLSGYVQMQGKPGMGNKKAYSVTSFGHRYLNEHQDELAAYEPPKGKRSIKEIRTAEGSDSGERHMVPEMPDIPTVKIPDPSPSGDPTQDLAEIHAPKPSAEKKYKDVGGILRRFKKSCSYCGEEFATDIAEREYCCRDHLERDIETESATKPTDLEPEEIEEVGPTKRRTKPCVFCGKETSQGPYCSEECRKKMEAEAMAGQPPKEVESPGRPLVSTTASDKPPKVTIVPAPALRPITDHLPFIEQVKAAAAPLLFERFASQVTLKDVVEYLKEHEKRDVS